MKNLLLLLLILQIAALQSCKKDEDQDQIDPTIEYPSLGFYGENILDTIQLTYAGSDFSLAASLSSDAVLKIKITAMGNGFWFLSSGSEQNWQITDYNESTKSQIFSTISDKQNSDLDMEFHEGQYMIEYFEFGSNSVTRTKTIEIKTANNTDV